MNQVYPAASSALESSPVGNILHTDRTFVSNLLPFMRFSILSDRVRAMALKAAPDKAFRVYNHGVSWAPPESSASV